MFLLNESVSCLIDEDFSFNHLLLKKKKKWNLITIGILCASFSYPRTESTAYPSSFDFRGTLSALANNPVWGDYVERLLAEGYAKPRSGTDAGDHPPITPMRSATEDMLGKDAWRLYSYVCQHFLGTVSPDCKYIR